MCKRKKIILNISMLPFIDSKINMHFSLTKECLIEWGILLIFAQLCPTKSSDIQSRDCQLECVLEVKVIPTSTHTKTYEHTILYHNLTNKATQHDSQHYSSSRILSPLGFTTRPMYRMELVLLSFTRKMKG